ncbi:YceI family protein [uncultured Pedobacter sp.]|uniref:YceI family protein n=1 Tax=uncultured Pedobacter sp. TaxID=246139 RepID=UPI00260E1F86|nr:YceI family protein [uncultured Pedobacter sp.]
MANTTIWAIDPAHSEITFKVKHMMISNVKGEFKTFSGKVDGEDFTTSKITVTIDAASIFTNDQQRDTHLKSADFFEVENYKELTFESISFTKVDEENYQLKGQLTIKGISKEVNLDVEFGGINKDPWGNEKAGFSVTGKINRKDWGLNWNTALETGGVLVSEAVTINADVQLVKQEA